MSPTSSTRHTRTGTREEITVHESAPRPYTLTWPTIDEEMPTEKHRATRDEAMADEEMSQSHARPSDGRYTGSSLPPRDMQEGAVQQPRGTFPEHTRTE